MGRHVPRSGQPGPAVREILEVHVVRFPARTGSCAVHRPARSGYGVAMQDNHISDDRARRFVAELRRFEQDGDPGALAGLFAGDATVQRLDARGERTDVEAFWREYRGQFEELSTTFTDAVEGDDQVALEWTTAGTQPGGRPIHYRGVTVLDFKGDAVAALRTYYDTAAFTPGHE